MVNVVGNGWTGRDPETHVLQENHALYAQQHSFWPQGSEGSGLSTAVVYAQHWHSWNTFTGENIVNYTNMKEMADALISTGMAEADPAADNTTDYGRQQNRRVAVSILVSKVVDGMGG